MKKAYLILVMSLSMAYFVSAQETRVEPNTCLTVESGTTLDVSGGDLIIESDATGDASLIDLGAVTYTGGGTANVERYLTEGKWHLVSPSVSGTVSGMFTDDYLQYHSEGSNGWTDIVPLDTDINVMQGYALWSISGSATTEVFTGATNTGAQSTAFTQGGLGWNLVGNPYPSTLDWDAVTVPGGMNGAIWLFDATIGTNGDYVYYINGGGAGNTTSQYIPSGQGFFVRATGGSGTLAIDNGARVHGGQDFYKSTEIEILVLKATGNGITTQTAIRFNENATSGVDDLYDVYRIISDSPEVPMLFTKSGDEKMAINTLSAIAGNETVPMWFRAGMIGTYTISANEIGTFDKETPIYLEDLNTGAMQNLREVPEYSFGYKSGSDKGFMVHFTKPENNAIESNINIFAFNNTLNVNFPVPEITNNAFSAEIMVFDLTGKTILQTTTTKTNNQIPLSGSNTIYMVKVVSGSEVVNEKVFIK